MKNASDFNIKRIMQHAESDSQYHQLLEYYRETEGFYRRVSEHLSAEEAEIIEQYLAAGESVYYRLSQIAYQCGQGSRKT